MSTSFSAFILGQEVYKYYQPAFAYSQLEVAISFYQKQHKKAGAFLPPPNRLSCCLQHILNKNPVPSRRIVHKDMGDCAHQFPVLNDRATAHE